jgi:hypothetical protein
MSTGAKQTVTNQALGIGMWSVRDGRVGRAPSVRSLNGGRHPPMAYRTIADIRVD